MKKNHLILVSFVLTAVLLCALSVSAQDADAPAVYFTSDISPEGLQRVYEALNWSHGDRVAKG